MWSTTINIGYSYKITLRCNPSTKRWKNRVCKQRAKQTSKRTRIQANKWFFFLCISLLIWRVIFGHVRNFFIRICSIRLFFFFLSLSLSNANNTPWLACSHRRTHIIINRICMKRILKWYPILTLTGLAQWMAIFNKYNTTWMQIFHRHTHSLSYIPHYVLKQGFQRRSNETKIKRRTTDWSVK